MPANTRRGLSIRIFLPDGTSDGLRIVAKSNWIGRAVVCPRSQFREAKGRPEGATADKQRRLSGNSSAGEVD